jgi:glycerol kinase
MHARGTVVGLSAGTGKNHIIRAALESIAYQSEDVISAMNSDMAAIGGEGITSLRVDGGASANGLLMQMQSDISGISVTRAANPEATAAGAAYLAGLAVGFFKDREELARLSGTGKTFTPEIGEEERKKALGGWRRAVRACRVFAEED